MKAKGVFEVIWTVAVFGFGISTWASVERDQEITESLRKLRADPVRAMEEVPVKRDASGRIVSEGLSVFPDKTIARRDYVAIKVEKRGQIRPRLTHLMKLGPIQPDEDPTILVDQLVYVSLEKMQEARLEFGTIQESPWSGDYWPYYLGNIARRYADPDYPDSSDWKANFDYLMKNVNVSSLELLSPAEKYDLITGDPNQSMAQWALAEGSTYYKMYGKVEPWMGICHGWAVASYMSPRPQKAIEVIAADGKTKVPLLPTDIKALSSLLWSKARFPVRTAGSRCNKKDPQKNENGRVIDPECFDTSPGAWHLTLVNRLGNAKKTFVIDATFDYQVWNQPLVSYRYSYFNPLTELPVRTLDEAKVTIGEYKNDLFKPFRAPNAAAVVGIAMDLTYVAENPPSMDRTDDPSKDRLLTVRYLYDLELNQLGEIIGGEWYTHLHPDFLWAPMDGAQAKSMGDYQLDRSNSRDEWNGLSAIPQSWKNAAAVSAQYGQPLTRLVDTLTLLSRIGF